MLTIILGSLLLLTHLILTTTLQQPITSITQTQNTNILELFIK